MRRLSLVLALVAAAALVVAAAFPAGAAPARTGTPLALDCGDDGIIPVLVQFESNGVPVFELEEGNGRQYVISDLHFRVWEGNLASEPEEGDPVFEEMKTWGKRNGYNETLTCSGSLVQSFDPEGTFTSFFDVVLSGK
jgi:hypothetical protein